MAAYNETVFKTLIFRENEVIEKLADNSAVTRSNASVLGELRTRKAKKDIKGYNKEKIDAVNIYKIQLEDGVIAIHMHESDISNTILNTILKSSKIACDEVNVVINGDHYFMRSRNSEREKSGRNIDDMIQFLDSMQRNKELENVTKSGTKMLLYTFETTENEKIKITIDSENKEVVEKLDKFPNIYLKKRNLKRNVIAGIAVGVALTVATPFVYKPIRGFLETKRIESQMDLETKFYLMSSYALRLQSDNLSSEDYDRFRELVSEVMEYYESANKTGQDYETLQSYEQLIDENYQDMMRGRTY